MHSTDPYYNRKIRIVRDIVHAADQYKTRMVGRSFLYVFENNVIEVRFRKKDFLHLTGVETEMSAESFYNDAVQGILRPEQLYFSPRHPYRTCSKKTSKLHNLHKLIDSDVFLLEDVTTNTFTFKFGVTDLNFTLCISANNTHSGQVLGDYYFPRSLRIEDAFKRSNKVYEVSCIFEKLVSKKEKYNKISFHDERFKIEDLPPQILELIDGKLLHFRP